MRSEIALLAQAQTDASPVVQAGGKVPAKHPGIELGRVKVSVVGLYNSAECSACC